MTTSLAAGNRSFVMSTAALKPQAAADHNRERHREFNAIVSRALPKFQRIAMRQLRNREDAEDAVQDAMLSAFRHMAQFDGRAQLSTWVMAIVVNSVRMQIRRRMRRRVLSLDERSAVGLPTAGELLVDPQPTPEQSLARHELRELVRKTTHSLPPRQQAALQLRVRDDLSVRKVAAALGVPQGTVKAQLSRGRAEIRRRLQHVIGSRRKKFTGSAGLAHGFCMSGGTRDAA
ncbi:MAG: sigma-70 family RNA polymerase sigma factor [Candidatus Sulfotelmatobacter sp.]|jgi:RNA polymerase sigma-70 factor, ECF subfamily